MRLAILLTAALAVAALAQVVVFSDGSGYAAVGKLGVSVYSIDGRFLFSGGAPAYVGPTCIGFYTGAGVSIVGFRGGLKAFYPLNFTPTVLATDCVAVVAANQTLGVYITPAGSYSFRLPAAPYAAAVLNGVGYILDLEGDVVEAGPGGVSTIGVGGYPAGLAASIDCVAASVVRGGTQYFYRVDGGTAQLLGSRPVKVGLAYSFAVGPGCRLALPPGDKGTAVAVDGPYTIYGTSTGLLEVYLGGRLVYSRDVGAPVLSVSSAGLNLVYETPEGAYPLILVNYTVSSSCGNWSALAPSGSPPQPPPEVQFPNGTRCLLTASEAADRTVYASYVRQYYVVLSSPRPFSGWLNASAEVPPPPPVSLDYVELAPVGWLVDGRIVGTIAVASPVEARAVYRLVPLVNGTLGNGTAVYVLTPNATVVWPQTPSYSVERYYYVSVQPPGAASGGNGYYPAGSVVSIYAAAPPAPPGCRYVFSGWVGLNATSPNATVAVDRPISASPQFREECAVVLTTKYGMVVNAPGWAAVGSVLSPSVEPTAVWAPFPLRYVFVGWNVSGVLSTQFAVSGPVHAEAVWALDPTPLVALAAALAAVAGAVFYLSARRRKGRSSGAAADLLGKRS
ncbi:MAG: type II/IV secretion system protein [Thermoproteus sp.]